MEYESSTQSGSLSSDSLSSLSLLITICDRGQGKKVTDFFKDRNASFNLMVLGKGTASSKMLDYLGLGQTEKMVLLSVMPTAEARDVLSKFDETLELKRPGHGIAFTLPLNGACVRKSVETVPDGEIEEKMTRGGEEDEVVHSFEHSLIIAVVNRGYNQEVMEAARTAKATGGTIIHARGFALSGVEKFFGVSIHPEKEVIIILAENDRKRDIMRAISEKAGIETPAGAVTFSLPVSGVEGLQPYLEQAEESES
ncbi:MAG: hypothetical protein LBJ36_02610 [Synergistaceae bacterium]|jgi:hypothetical protein|nr:hypothetical protein [Synergistaceae bacterium]